MQGHALQQSSAYEPSEYPKSYSYSTTRTTRYYSGVGSVVILTVISGELLTQSLSICAEVQVKERKASFILDWL